MLDYKTFDYLTYNVDSKEKAIALLDMLSWFHFKKECAMTPRDDKWGYSLLKITDYIKQNVDDKNE